jgi:glutamine amidotransferase-like uncharacterized protein
LALAVNLGTKRFTSLSGFATVQQCAPGGDERASKYGSMRNLCREFIASSFLLVALSASGIPACTDAPGMADVLLFAGDGTSRNDVASIETILKDSRISYSRVSSSRLNDMTQSTLSAHRLLIVPGGDFVEIGNSLSAVTTTNVRNSVKGGMNYLGICAGGFLAGNFPAPYKSFDLSSGVKFAFYSAEKNGIRRAALTITTVDGPALDHYWEDGPQFAGWGEVVGKYPDGTPAIVEGMVGRGLVILSGVHAEAPASWRRGIAFRSTVSADTAYARKLIIAGLNRATLAHY